MGLNWAQKPDLILKSFIIKKVQLDLGSNTEKCEGSCLFIRIS
ncbi:MAG: hypothetical protein N4J56_003358 [Chroococcidiopsis sp. SAG 2025]|nr:hypothetical protein [Chroococcidiopsis sp. SAG 2025]